MDEQWFIRKLHLCFGVCFVVLGYLFGCFTWHVMSIGHDYFDYVVGFFERIFVMRLRSLAIGVVAAVSAVGVGVPALAVPRVVPQPGTARPAVVAPVRVAPQAAPVPAPVVQFVPGARAASQPVIVKNVVTQEIVQVTSPGLALASGAGSSVLNPVNVVNTFERNVRSEDRATMDAARGAAGVGAALGGVVGGALGAGAFSAGGAALGAGAGVGICGAATAAVPVMPLVAPFAAGCWAAGPAVVGPAIGGTVGAGMGFPVGAAPGALAGAQLGASAVPGGRAVMDRVIADTTWDLESQARVQQGAEPLVGAKPGDSMPGGGGQVAPPALSFVNNEIARVNDQINAALSSAGGSSMPQVQLPQIPGLSG